MKRRDRTPEDCGYLFDSSEECTAFVASMNSDQAFVADEYLRPGVWSAYPRNTISSSRGRLKMSLTSLKSSCPKNLKRRDRTPQDCGYYIEFKNGRTIRHDFDSSEDCKAFVAALNKGESLPVVTEEAEARAEQAAAELLAELGLDTTRDNQVKKTKKKKGVNKKKKVMTGKRPRDFLMNGVFKEKLNFVLFLCG
ncbi:hypothetical protein THAOC_00813 [Thalassiosira oceanica]|uniref:Uncharacterized protein n=1 Tax=Thalassiosira oceanica TaxID=159749 RepID=K0TNP9_THAOC|nr:hypothetical protein THAOC_00813 [Thalassiosira oceanica]|eukprot:EJK77361.1 hypothetical protein THAOC_00813 [Thalassiosira oceanica]